VSSACFHALVKVSGCGCAPSASTTTRPESRHFDPSASQITGVSVQACLLIGDVADSDDTDDVGDMPRNYLIQNRLQIVTRIGDASGRPDLTLPRRAPIGVYGRVRRGIRGGSGRSRHPDAGSVADL